MTVVAADHLRAFVQRIMRLKEEQDALSADIREVYAEAKGMGFDKQAMGQLVTYLRKKEKDGAKLEEQSAIFELYRDTYEHGSSHAHTRARHENINVEQAVPAAENFEPPAFLRKHVPLRPHCQNPADCAGYGAKHCHECLKAAAASEAA